MQGVTALRLKMAGQRQVSFLEIKLNLRQIAELLNVSLRTIQHKAKTGQIPAECTLNSLNRPEYTVLLSDLPSDIQRRWYERNGERAEVTELLEEAKQKIGKKPANRKELDHYTAAEREQIAFWMDVVDEWRAYRSGDGRAAQRAGGVRAGGADHDGADDVAQSEGFHGCSLSLGGCGGFRG